MRNRPIFISISLVYILFIFPSLYSQSEGDRINITDTSVKKNFIDIDFYFGADKSDYRWVVAGWDYTGGGVYEFDREYLDNGNRRLTALFEDKDKYLFSVKVLEKADIENNNIFLAAGYYSKCLCAVLLRKKVKNDYWEELFFDETIYPYISNIFCIETNTLDFNNKSKFSRVFLGCSNGAIFYSDSNGEIFKQSTIYTNKESIKRIKFFNDTLGLALAGSTEFGNEKIYKTSDGGLSWFLLKDFSNEGFLANDLIIGKPDFLQDKFAVILVGSVGNKGMIKVSYDFGVSFSDLKLRLSSDTNEFPGPLVSGSLMNNDFVSIMDNGISGVCFADYSATCYFPYPANDNENFSIGKMTRIADRRYALPNTPLIAIGYDGLIYKYYINSTVNVNEDYDNSEPVSHYDVNSNSLKIYMKFSKNYDVEKIYIYNILGEKILESNEFPSEQIEIKLPALSHGLYIFELLGKKNKKSGKFLIY